MFLSAYFPRKLAAVALLAMLGTSSIPASAYKAPVPQSRAPNGTLAVMTYNVEGLPWPVAWGRSNALGKIADRLQAMRRQGTAPHIVVLQEAFIPAARRVGAVAGYPYVVSGPDADQANRVSPPASAAGFANGARWWKGETEGKYVGSGLEVLSDFPVLAVRRMAFPTYACAGFDCLANKGALMVTLAVPGLANPVDVVTTHLNSRHASGVSSDRSDKAYQMQVAALSAFVRNVHDPRHMLIVAGDFNVGQIARRRAALLTAAAHDWSPGQTVGDAWHGSLAAGAALPPDAQFSLHHAKDWQFYSGRDVRFRVAAIEVPFGHDRQGRMLSDHVGYVARYKLDAMRSANNGQGAAPTMSGPPKT